MTADDYAALAARDFRTELQGASADLVWTGSWYEAHVTLDPFGTEESSTKLQSAVRADLEKYRRMGHDLRLAPTRYVPLSITLFVCVKPDYQRDHVRAALMDVFSARLRADGTPGFFHPDNLRFARSIDVSQLVAAAQRVPGVLWSRVSKLERFGEGDAGELEAGTLPLERNEIARVGSSAGTGVRPGFPELGSITFEMGGGR